MKEEGPKPEEKGSYTNSAGSAESFIQHARIKAAGIERGMQGISEAAELVTTIGKLGDLGEKFPEFRYWIDRKFDEAEKMGEEAKGGKDITAEIKNWRNTMEDAISNWSAPRKEKMWYERTKKNVEAIKHLRRTIRYAVRRWNQAGGPAGLMTGEYLEELKKQDLERLEKIEDEVITENDTEETQFEINALFVAYRIPDAEQIALRRQEAA